MKSTKVKCFNPFVLFVIPIAIGPFVIFVVKDYIRYVKTIMGTIPKSSSHSPFAAEAAYSVGLLLF
jgi:hypothetical protein